ncbi:MAG: M15 family metallopeptidase [Clostridiales Family XIII bacterium]|nr:M15 family metallopeptidase [Clostridiales Family XIII bacterium]
MKKNHRRQLCAMLAFLLAAIATFAVLSAIRAHRNDADESGPETGKTGAAEERADMSGEDGDEAPAPDYGGDYGQYIGKAYKTDISAYLQYIEPTDSDPYLMLVNKTHLLAENFVPENLIDVKATRQDGRKTQRMQEAAAKALEAFMAEAAAEGVTNVTVTSAYRSFAEQAQLFNMNVENHLGKFSDRAEAEEYVSTFSARPGTSEHQTGLVADMHNLPSAEQSFGDTPEADWLRENACRFGFVMRYAPDKQAITGVIYEPWHFRFVGRKAATEMFLSNRCLEEYLDEAAS